MKRIFAFIMLKVVELLAVWIVAIQIPYCLGMYFLYLISIEMEHNLHAWGVGLCLIFAGGMIILGGFRVLLWLFNYDGYYGDEGIIIRWIVNNWETAKKMEWKRKKEDR